MHLENGKIIGDTGRERRFLAEAETLGAELWSSYPNMLNIGQEEQEAFISKIEDGERIGEQAILRGLIRMAVSHRRTRLKAIGYLVQLAEQALSPEAE